MIRLATTDDIPIMVEMGFQFHSAADLSSFGLEASGEDFSTYLAFMIQIPYAAVFVATDGEDEIIGSIAGIRSPWFMDMAQVLITEQWWWVDPLHRGGTVHKDLIKVLSLWGKESGGTKLVMVSINDDKVGRYYQRKGFRQMETHWIKDI